MLGVALRMLFGDQVKFLGLVAGVAFTTLLITQQSAIFVGLMLRTVSIISDTAEADIWVMDPRARFVDLVRPLRDTELQRVRGVDGVAWAVPLYKADAPVRTLGGDVSGAQLIGVDEVALVGVPRRLRLGRLEDLRRPDAIAITEIGYRKLWPGEPLRLGQTLELNDHRAVVRAITDTPGVFYSSIVIYARYGQAVRFLPQGRGQLSFVVARAEDGQDAAVVASRIAEVTGLQALTRDAFAWKTISYYLRHTGIPLNFAVVIALGVVVGVAVVGLIFSMFISDNTRQFGTLKALGLGDQGVCAMVLAQAALVGISGYGLGLGMAAGFFQIASRGEFLGYYLPWWVAAVSAALTVLIMSAVASLGLRRVRRLDPALVSRS